MDIQSYKDLRVWQLGIDIALDIYKHTKSYPKEEIYGFTSQMRRCAASIPANLAEGASRESTKQLLHHVAIAMGSVAELETFLILAKKLSFGNPAEISNLLERLAEEGRMLRGLQRSLKTKLTATDH